MMIVGGRIENEQKAAQTHSHTHNEYSKSNSFDCFEMGIFDLFNFVSNYCTFQLQQFSHELFNIQILNSAHLLRERTSKQYFATIGLVC